MSDQAVLAKRTLALQCGYQGSSLLLGRVSDSDRGGAFERAYGAGISGLVREGDNHVMHVSVAVGLHGFGDNSGHGLGSACTAGGSGLADGQARSPTARCHNVHPVEGRGESGHPGPRLGAPGATLHAERRARGDRRFGRAHRRQCRAATGPDRPWVRRGVLRLPGRRARHGAKRRNVRRTRAELHASSSRRDPFQLGQDRGQSRPEDPGPGRASARPDDERRSGRAEPRGQRVRGGDGAVRSGFPEAAMVRFLGEPLRRGRGRRGVGFASRPAEPGVRSEDRHAGPEQACFRRRHASAAHRPRTENRGRQHAAEGRTVLRHGRQRPVRRRDGFWPDTTGIGCRKGPQGVVLIAAGASRHEAGPLRREASRPHSHVG